MVKIWKNAGPNVSGVGPNSHGVPGRAPKALILTIFGTLDFLRTFASKFVKMSLDELIMTRTYFAPTLMSVGWGSIGSQGLNSCIFPYLDLHFFIFWPLTLFIDILIKIGWKGAKMQHFYSKLVHLGWLATNFDEIINKKW